MTDREHPIDKKRREALQRVITTLANAQQLEEEARNARHRADRATSAHETAVNALGDAMFPFHPKAGDVKLIRSPGGKDVFKLTCINPSKFELCTLDVEEVG